MGRGEGETSSSRGRGERGEAEMVGKQILTGREREREIRNKYLGFIKRQRYKFFFLI